MNISYRIVSHRIVLYAIGSNSTGSIRCGFVVQQIDKESNQWSLSHRVRVAITGVTGMQKQLARIFAACLDRTSKDWTVCPGVVHRSGGCHAKIIEGA